MDPVAEDRSPHDRLLDAMLPEVAFDGWNAASLSHAAAALGLDPAEVQALAPRGAAGLAADHHRRGDARMRAALAAAEPGEIRFRDRIARAIRLRLEGEDREVIRRSMAHFALPQHSAEGARLIWDTADAIWTALGDNSDDLNWYTKRLTLAGVISATVLYWLGDASEGAQDTWAFLDRRIEDVMRLESAKASLRRTPLIGRLMESPLNPLTHIRAPRSAGPEAWPGRWAPSPPQAGAGR